MMQNRPSGTNTLLLLLVSVVTMIYTSSCSSSKKVAYFTDVPDTTYVPTNIKLAEFLSPVIKANDILQVSIQTIDPTTTALFNEGNKVVSGGENSQSIAGYLVDKDGNIELPLVGKMQVAGKTTIQAREDIKRAVMKYYKDPVVNIRFMNFNITLLGDVGRPGTYSIPTEKVSVLDALGLAGDLQISGRRENIMVIRDVENQKQIVRLDLNSTALMASPYFYLKTGDVVYVEPNTAKERTATLDPTKDRYIGYGISGVGLLLSIITFIRVTQSTK